MNIGRLFLAFAFAALVTTEAKADVFVDFSIGSTGTISYAGGTTPLMGNVSVTSVVGQNTPMLDGVSQPLPGATAVFTTGDFLGVGGSGNTWNFGPGGTFVLTGPIPNIPQAGITELFRGTFVGDTTVQPVGNGKFRVLAAGVRGNLNGLLSDEFGITTGTAWEAGLATLFTATGAAGDKFTSESIQSGNFSVNTTPEPSSSLLMGLGILGTGAVVAARKRKGGVSP